MAKLRALAETLWVAHAPHTMLGVHVGTRMSVVRLPGGALLIHSPIALDAALRAEVDALGEVSHIVLPNDYHHTYAGPWIDAYPRATTHASRGLLRKRADLRLDHQLGPRPHRDWGDALIPVPIEGCMLNETVFVHPSSRTLITVDLTENFVHGSDHVRTRMWLRFAGNYGKVGWPRPMRLLYRDRKAARRSIETILDHDFDRLIISHGELIEDHPKAAIEQTFAGWLR